MQTSVERTRIGAEERDATIHAKAVELVRLSLEMTAAAGSGHPTSAASLAHLVTVLLYDHMRWDPLQPDHPAADRLVLSEGHAVPVIYAAAADLGVAIGRNGRRAMTREDALDLRAIDSPIDGHPNPAEGFPFFPAATGSLGQGLSIAAGIALAARVDRLDKRVYCLIGDGESREGQVWEALDFLIDQRLTAVCAIFNANGQGQTGPVSAQQSAETLAAKLAAFGTEPFVFDGHDPRAIREALERHAQHAGRTDAKPVTLVVRTVKGWGTPSLAAKRGGFHGQVVEGPELERVLEELERTTGALVARWSGAALRIPPVTAAAPPVKQVLARRALPTLRGALADLGQPELLATGKLAPRKAYGVALHALGKARSDVVALDGDVSNSTYAEFFARDPELATRFFECRIAEQNMASCAAGLAAAGKVPFVSTFGKFLTRAYDQIEMAIVSGLALRLVGSHVGVSLAADGPSQMALPDAAWFAAFGRAQRDGRPLAHVLTPADAFAAYALTLEMAYHDGTTYLRTARPEVKLLYDEKDQFQIGGHRVLREGADLALMAWGYALHVALAAADGLQTSGIGAAVVDLYSLPFDGESVAALARASGGRVVTVEDNYGGTLGAAVAEALVQAEGEFHLRPMFVRRVPKSGRTPEDVLEFLGLTHLDVERVARNLLAETRARR